MFAYSLFKNTYVHTQGVFFDFIHDSMKKKNVEQVNEKKKKKFNTDIEKISRKKGNYFDFTCIFFCYLG